MSYMHRIRGMNSHLAAALGLNPEIVSRLCCMLLDGWPEALLSCLSLRGLVGLPSSSMKGLKGSRGMMLSGLPSTASLVEARLAGRDGRVRERRRTCQDRTKKPSAATAEISWQAGLVHIG